VSLPRVLGQTREEAERRLSAAGVTEIEVTRTAPPRGPHLVGPPRVVRQRGSGAGVSLVVAATVPPPQGDDSHD
jgi:hypothetical protein